MHPDLILEDSAKLLQLLYEEKPECVEHLIGSVEQTTAGSKRISLMDSVGILKKPVIAASNSVIKYWFDNKYGVGQTALGTLLHLTGDLVAGITVVIVGYGSVGHGCAARCAGAGAHVIVSESDPVRALQAYYDGYFVMDIDRAAKLGDVFITATGSSNVIPFECIRNMKSGARLINLGSGQSEIPVSEIKENAIRRENVSDSETKYYFSKEKFVQLVADGRTANLVVVGGNPPSIMDLTFASMLLSLEYLLKNDGKLEAHLLSAPYETDCNIALLKLNELGVDINKKTTAQIKYDSDWRTK